jgi:predicted secreted protein
MSLVTGIAVYFIIWWTVLFAVLPWGSRPPQQPEKGMADSAPANPRLLAKFIVTTLVSAVIFAGIWLVVEYGGISFRDMVRRQ